MNNLYYTALGDSITSALSCFLFDGFPNRLCRYFNKKCCRSNCNNFAKPGLTSYELLHQLKNCDEVRCAVKISDIITITIGGNNLLRSTYDNYRKINRKIADKEVAQFKQDWLAILDCIRNDICSQAKICVMTLYNPYPYKDPNYDLADYYICLINGAICYPPLVSGYNYSSVDVYNCFKNGNGDRWTFFNNPFSCWFRDPHPNRVGHSHIAKAFLRCINL